VPEAAVTTDIAAGLDAAGQTLAGLHIDRAYLASGLVRDRGPDLAIFCKAWRVRGPGGRYAKLRERVQVEHALAHIGHWQGRRARYIGTRKN
jgi:hypothetical protein